MYIYAYAHTYYAVCCMYVCARTHARTHAEAYTHIHTHTIRLIHFILSYNVIDTEDFLHSIFNHYRLSYAVPEDEETF